MLIKVIINKIYAICCTQGSANYMHCNLHQHKVPICKPGHSKINVIQNTSTLLSPHERHNYLYLTALGKLILFSKIILLPKCNKLKKGYLADLMAQSINRLSKQNFDFSMAILRMFANIFL